MASLQLSSDDICLLRDRFDRTISLTFIKKYKKFPSYSIRGMNRIMERKRSAHNTPVIEYGSGEKDADYLLGKKST